MELSVNCLIWYAALLHIDPSESTVHLLGCSAKLQSSLSLKEQKLRFVLWLRIVV